MGVGQRAGHGSGRHPEGGPGPEREQLGPPRLEGQPGATLVRLNAEHAIVRLDGEAQRLRVGDRVRLLPSKTETTIDLHAEYFCLRGGVLEAVVPIDARGRFR